MALAGDRLAEVNILILTHCLPYFSRLSYIIYIYSFPLILYFVARVPVQDILEKWTGMLETGGCGYLV